jgi:hypothetical protein
MRNKRIFIDPPHPSSPATKNASISWAVLFRSLFMDIRQQLTLGCMEDIRLVMNMA